MLISEIEKQIKSSHYAKQLFGVKRCFGSHSKIGVLSEGKTIEYGTLAELQEVGLISKGFLHLDPYFENVPKVTDFPYDTFDIRLDGNNVPECPNVVAERTRLEAETRAKIKRNMITYNFSRGA